MSLAEPCAVAAAPPTRMYSTPASAGRRRSAAKSVKALPILPGGPAQLFGKSLKFQEVQEPLLDRPLEVLADQGAIHILIWTAETSMPKAARSRSMKARV